MFVALRKGTQEGDGDKEEWTVLLLMLVSHKPVEKVSLRENLSHNNFLISLPLTLSPYAVSPLKDCHFQNSVTFG